MPSGMFFSGRQLPGRMSTFVAGHDRVAHLQPGRLQDVALLAVGVGHAARCAPSGSGRTRSSTTFAGMSFLSRLKSMMRYRRLWPPPRHHDVSSPRLLRPPDFFSGSVSGLCGSRLGDLVEHLRRSGTAGPARSGCMCESASHRSLDRLGAPCEELRQLLARPRSFGRTPSSSPSGGRRSGPGA